MVRHVPGLGERSCRDAFAAVVLVAITVSSGCTLCPDPFDYSGPVPDGSPPQNDFRARAGGILSLNAAPRPWPPVVRDGTSDGSPTIADPEPQLVEEAETVPLRQASVLVPADAMENAPDVTDMPPVLEAPVPEVPIIEGSPQSAEQAEQAADRQEGEVDAERVADTPPETPGWRPRR